METIKFSSTNELYNRVKPALECKKNDLKRKGYPYLKIEDIFLALKDYKWNTAHDLSLYEIVDDILNTNDEFFLENLRKENVTDLEKLNIKDSNIL